MRSFIAWSGFALAGLALFNLSPVQAESVPGEAGSFITASAPGEVGLAGAARLAKGEGESGPDLMAFSGVGKGRAVAVLISQAAPGETGPRPIPETNS